MTTTLEFWPEYGGGPLWSEGKSVDLASLDWPQLLRDQLLSWNGRYDDSKMPFEGNDVKWLGEGRQLLGAVRVALGVDYEVVVSEEWWDED